MEVLVLYSNTYDDNGLVLNKHTLKYELAQYINDEEDLTEWYWVESGLDDMVHEVIAWCELPKVRGVGMTDEEKAEKWWIVPTNSPFFNSNLFDIFGYNYKVEPQEDFYSKSFPPLKSDFNSKEEAEKWLKEYLETKENETCEEIIIGEQQEINDLKKENEELKKQLEKENAELKERVEQLSNDNHVLKTSFIMQQGQIKKMKCCANCNGIINGIRQEKCKFCMRSKLLSEWELSE